MFSVTRSDIQGNVRTRRSSSEMKFLTDSIEELMQSHLKTQDSVLHYQSDMIQNLIKSQNNTQHLDEQFYSLTEEIRQVYTALSEHLTPLLEKSACTVTEKALYALIGCLLVSLFFNLYFALIYYQMCFPRFVSKLAVGH